MVRYDYLRLKRFHRIKEGLHMRKKARLRERQACLDQPAFKPADFCFSLL